MSTHQVTRLNISVDQPYEQFRKRLHAAVPNVNAKRLAYFIEQQANWGQRTGRCSSDGSVRLFLLLAIRCRSVDGAQWQRLQMQ